MDKSRTNDPDSLEVFFEVLADQRRRYVLYYLQTASAEVVWFDEVVTQIADWETPPDTEPTNAHREEVEIALRHNHLPKLKDRGIIDYESQREVIRYWEPLTKQTWLEQAKIEEINAEEQVKGRSDEEFVTAALIPALKASYDADAELERSFNCSTDPAYPDWDVTIVEVNSPSEEV